MALSRRDLLKKIGVAGLVLLGNGFKGIWKHSSIPQHCLLPDGERTVIGHTPIHAPPEYSSSIAAHLQFLRTVVKGEYLDDLEGILFVQSEQQGCKSLGLGSEESVAAGMYFDQMDTMAIDTDKHLRIQPAFKIGETPYRTEVKMIQGQPVKHLYGGPIHRQVGQPVIEPYFAGWEHTHIGMMRFEYEVNHELGHHCYDRDYFGDDPEEALVQYDLIPSCLFRAVIKDIKHGKFETKNQGGEDFETTSCNHKFSIDDGLFDEHVHVWIYAEMLTALRLLTEKPEYNPSFQSHDLQIARSSRQGLEYEVQRREEMLQQQPEAEVFGLSRVWGNEHYNRHLQYFESVGALPSSAAQELRLPQAHHRAKELSLQQAKRELQVLYDLAA